MRIDYSLRGPAGAEPQLGRFIAMAEAVRVHTAGCVTDLTLEQLDHQHDAYSNSVGMLLGHIVYGDVAFIAMVLEGRDLSQEEERRWGAGRWLWERGRSEFKGRSIHEYQEALVVYREVLCRRLAELEDSWLERAQGGRGRELALMSNAYLMFHLIEDECRHQGQIFFLLHRLPNYKLAFWNRRPQDRPPLSSRALSDTGDGAR